MKRKFEGIWIPREVWLSEELSLQEKILYCEANSLDNDEGCFASNKHFASFLQLKERRVQDVINSLEEKGYITRKFIYFENTKRIKKRIIRTTDKVTRSILKSHNSNGAENCVTKHAENCVTPHAGNCVDNNTKSISTNIYIYLEHLKIEKEKLDKLKLDFERVNINHYLDKIKKHDNFKTYTDLDKVLRFFISYDIKKLKDKSYVKVPIKEIYLETGNQEAPELDPLIIPEDLTPEQEAILKQCQQNKTG